MRFYSIFIPGTVPYLCSGPLSLAHHEPSVELVLVANGLTADEYHSLSEFATRYGLRILDLATPRPLPHGIALNAVFQQHPLGQPFAFVDNDIYAHGPWLSELISTYSNQGWACSGFRLEDRHGITYRGCWGGSATRADDGTALTTTYLAIIDSSIISEMQDRYSVGFESISRRSQLNSRIDASIAAYGLEDERFDTGKLLSYLVAKHRGISSFYCSSPALHHIGGLSTAIAHRRQARASTNPTEPFHLSHSLFESTNHQQSDRRNETDVARKHALAGYFAELILSSFDASPVPTRDALPVPWEQRIAAASSALHDAMRFLD